MKVYLSVSMLVKSLAASLGCSSGRIQFTPDLLPSDITGINYFNIKRSEFELMRGPIFSNILLADEINRATPKTQSGLLESMEECQTTIDGVSYPLPEPFMVIATQNPIENMGVFPLPEAQLDRFLVKVNMDYPSHDESISILERFREKNPLDTLSPVTNAEEIAKMKEITAKIFVHRDIMSYICTVCEETRSYESVAIGASPRGALALMRCAKGYAAIRGRSYVSPDDVKTAAPYVLPHRLMLTTNARIKKNMAKNIISDILAAAPVPTEYIR